MTLNKNPCIIGDIVDMIEYDGPSLLGRRMQQGCNQETGKNWTGINLKGIGAIE